MLFTKRSKKFLNLSLLLLIFTLTSCTIYKSAQVNPINADSIKLNYLYKKIAVVHDASFQNEYILMDLVVEDDILKGTIVQTPPGKKHSPTKRTFRKGKVSAYVPLMTMHIYTTLKEIKTGEFETPINSIIGIEVHEKDIGLSTLATLGIIIGGVVVGTGVFLAIACNCPQVESFNPDGSSQIHGALFPGAMLKALQRDDYLILDNLATDDLGNVNLRISNILAETEFIDHLEVQEVAHSGFSSLALSNENKLVAYNQPLPPINAFEDSTENITDLIKEKDHLSYQFDQYDSFDELNEMTLQFNRSSFIDNPTLIIKGQQTPWLDTVANFILNQGGTSFEKWQKKKDNPSFQKNWEKSSKKRGLSLNVYLKINDNWEYAGTHHNAGTSSMRNIAMNLDVSDIQSSLIEIKLVSAYKLWEIDYVGLTNEWKTDLKINTLDITSAKNQDGKDVSEEISSKDENFLIQHEGNTYVDIEANTLSEHSASTFVLHGNGYYHHNTDYENKRNLKFFLKLRDELAIQDVSRTLNQYKSLAY